MSQPDSMISIGATGANVNELLPEVLTWLTLSQENVSDSNPPKESVTKATSESGRSLFEYLGMGVVILAVAYAIFGKKLKRKSS